VLKHANKARCFQPNLSAKEAPGVKVRIKYSIRDVICDRIGYRA